MASPDSTPTAPLTWVLALFFFVFVVFGVAFVGGDDDTGNAVVGGESTDATEDGTDDETADGEWDGEDDDTVRVPIATDSPVLEPYEEDADYENPDFSDLDESRVERLIVEHTNRFRANRSLGNLTYSETLSRPAREHSVNMSENNYLGHANPAGEGVEERYIDECDALRDGREEFEYSENAAVVWYKVVFESSLTEENVYARSEDGVADLLVDEWRASDVHRQNLLDPRWEAIGVGVTVDENGTVFGTQAFCSVGG